VFGAHGLVALFCLMAVVIMSRRLCVPSLVPPNSTHTTPPLSPVQEPGTVSPRCLWWTVPVPMPVPVPVPVAVAVPAWMFVSAMRL
jgi:hypothetical protein